ncbi:MAG: hypothetical protein R3C12_11320 [Planctomycetaceae bacterium]|nr:hypothetical protein [Planctomycetaceae bacterium]
MTRHSLNSELPAESLAAEQAAGNGMLDAPELRRRFQRKYEYSRVLLELATQQQELIEGDDFTGLIQLLARKQTLIEALQAVSVVEPPLVTQWRLCRDRMEPGMRRECEAWLEQSEQLLEQLLEFEQQCASRLQRQRNDTQQQLAAVSGTLHVQEAYQDFPEASHFDMNR